jgi:hypothetical protein
LLLSERRQSEKTEYLAILMLWHSGKGKTGDSTRLVVSRFGRKGVGMNRWSTYDFQNNESILYDTIMIDEFT